MGVDVKGFASTYDTQTEKVNTRNHVKTAGSPGESRPNLLVQKYFHGRRRFVTFDTTIQGMDTCNLTDRGHKGWRQETNYKKSEEVIERVKLLKVQDPIMNPKKLRFIVRFQILSMIEQALFELLSRINC